MKSRLTALLLSSLVAALVFVAAPPASAGCATGVEMGEASSNCIKSGNDTNAYIAGHSDHSYSIRPAWGVGGTALCAEPATCNVGGNDGWLYNVYQDADPEPLDWQACLTKQEARRLGGLTPDVV